MSVEMQQPSISELLASIGTGKIQLPDFQREYRWDVERIRELLVTVLRGHPMGVVMVLQTGNEQVKFKPKALTGVLAGGDDCKECESRYRTYDPATLKSPDYLLLDGQQRLTSIFQALSRDGVVHSADERGKLMHVRYFLDVEKCLGEASDQDESIVTLPADGIERTNFGRDVVRDCSNLAGQVSHGLMPLTSVFSDGPDSAVNWMLAYLQADPTLAVHRQKLFADVQNRVLTPMKAYQIPGIELGKETTREAVATVFEKVNTGGLALDTFELLTATFAGDPTYKSVDGADFRLVDDWKKTQQVLAKHPSLDGFQRIFFLQIITLLATRAKRAAELAEGKAKPRSISARREDILRLRLADYLEWADAVRDALPWVAQFFTSQHIHSGKFVPYPTQIVPLAAIRVAMGDNADKHAANARIRQWYWSGVLGELYGSTTETRFARDIEQVPAWALSPITGYESPAPDTVTSANFAESRLLTLRTRLSAAYKGLYALLMVGGCRDWLYNQDLDHASYADLAVDIHHIFPKKWCNDHGIDDARRESIVNKTALGRKTNIIVGGASPADYVKALEERSGLSGHALDTIIQTHMIDTEALRTADFDRFFDARKEALVRIVEGAMGKRILRDLAAEPEVFELEPDDPDEVDEEDL